MEVTTCRRCGKLFQHTTGPRVCIECKKVEEEIFQEVKEYLRENRGASMETVVQETRATAAQVQKFLREGRLEVAEGSPISINCERCGKAITKGKLCKKCSDQVAQGLSAAAQGMQPVKKEVKTENKNRMHFLNK